MKQKVKDFGDEYSLVSDSQDRHAVLESIGFTDSMDEYGCLFVLVGEADYEEVWGVWNSVAWLEADAIRLL